MLTEVQQVVLRNLQHRDHIYAKSKTIDHTARFTSLFYYNSHTMTQQLSVIFLCGVVMYTEIVEN